MKRAVLGLACLLVPCIGCIQDWGEGNVSPPRPVKRLLDVKTAVEGNTQFALDLYAQLCGKGGEGGNLVFSPFSIWTALAMTRAGARGDTAAEMDKVLHFTLPAEEQDAASACVLHDVTAAVQGCRLDVTNALWGQRGTAFTPEFLGRTRDYYGAGLREVDFANNSHQAWRRIYSGLPIGSGMRTLISADMPSSASRLTLTNAIYFKADWASPFKKNDTRDELFYDTARSAVQTRLMHQTGTFGYADAGTFQALEMPYKGGGLSMVVLLPNDVGGLARLEASLTAEMLDGCLRQMAQREVIVAFPRFKDEHDPFVGDALADMGMPLAFSRSADFSGMNGGKESLQIYNVFHLSWIDINEEGTETAGPAGLVRVDPVSPPFHPSQHEFRADHPFLFLIRDTRNGSILVMGRVTDPPK